MMRRIVCVCVVLCLAISLYGQDVSLLKHQWLADLEGGISYNLNTAQIVSTNNMQYFTTVTTTHGIQIKQYFVGIGVGYMHTYRDKENIYLMYGAFRYNWEKIRLNPFVDMRLGVVYDPHWISNVQTYVASSIGVDVCDKLKIGCKASIFSRPSRYFTACSSIVLEYVF